MQPMPNFSEILGGDLGSSFFSRISAMGRIFLFSQCSLSSASGGFRVVSDTLVTSSFVM